MSKVNRAIVGLKSLVSVTKQFNGYWKAMKEVINHEQEFYNDFLPEMEIHLQEIMKICNLTREETFLHLLYMHFRADVKGVENDNQLDLDQYTMEEVIVIFGDKDQNKILN